MVRLPGAVAPDGEVVDARGGDTRIDPARPEVDEEAEVLDGAEPARPAAVAGGLLDHDGRLESIELGAVGDTADLFVSRVVLLQFDRREQVAELTALQRPEVVRVDGEQRAEPGPGDLDREELGDGDVIVGVRVV